MEASRRLLKAETEYRAAQVEHDGSRLATERYARAVRELEIAFAIAQALLSDSCTLSHGAATGSIARRDEASYLLAGNGSD